jgi:hypothetical protein
VFSKRRFMDAYGHAELRSARFMCLINEYFGALCRFMSPGLSGFADESHSKIVSPRDEMFDLCSNFFLRGAMRDMSSTHMLIERSRPHV